jgi:hypothetical protein
MQGRNFEMEKLDKYRSTNRPRESYGPTTCLMMCRALSLLMCPPPRLPHFLLRQRLPCSAKKR